MCKTTDFYLQASLKEKVYGKSPHSGRTKNIMPFEIPTVSWEELQKHKRVPLNAFGQEGKS